ncbi:MAG: protein kinase [Phycisphaerales bacterium]|nr:protein kinase [Phycisphaerales bacterium]
MSRVCFHPGSFDDSGLAWGPKAGDPEFAPGDRLDAYRLVNLIGEGGFGMVYLADQEEPVRRKVAIKLIKPGMDTRHVVARFQAERQAMALMDHPGVARIYDAGTTPAGRPYFVMEYVRGDPISTYCDQNRLNVPERLRLFMEVCDAVQYAHQKGIIHRDIKPSNVLITTDGPRPLPKVIDWGVARATERDQDRSRTLMTEAGQFVGTPEYMSPEQARIGPLDVDTRADIYSLGVLLYQLLAGELPFESKTLRQGTFVDVQRVIVEMQPPKPSVKLQRSTDANVIAGRRRTAIGTLGRMLRDDLDWIVMKAMDKDRERRYSSAAELAADIRRHLVDEPVIAGAPSRWYRVRKLIKRNRGAVIAGGVAMALLLSAFLVASGLYWRERRLARSLSEAVALSRVRDEREAGLRAELERQRDEASALAREAQEARTRAEWRAYLAAVAAVEWARDIDPASAPARLLEARRAGADGQAGWELGVLASGLDQSGGTQISSPAAGVAVDGALGPLAALTDGRVVRVGDSGSEPLITLAGPVEAAQFSRDARFAAFGAAGRVHALEVARPGERHSQTEAGGAWALSDDGTLLAVGGSAGRLVRLPEGIEVARPAFLGSARTLTISPEGDLLACASISGDVTLHDIISGRGQDLVGADRQVPRCLAFSPRADALACGGDSGDIVIWPIDGGRARFPARLRGHRGPVNSLAFAPGGGFLASTSDDGTLRLWNLGDLTLLATLRGHTGPVRHVALGRGPEGLTLVSSGDDGVRSWNLPSIRAREAGLAVFAGEPVEAEDGGAGPVVRLSSGAIATLDLAAGRVQEVAAPGTGAVTALAPQGYVMRDGPDLVRRGWNGHELSRSADVPGTLVSACAERMAAASGSLLCVTDAGGGRHEARFDSTITAIDCGPTHAIVGLRSGEVREIIGADSRLVGTLVGEVSRVRQTDRGQVLAGSTLGEVLIEEGGRPARAWITGPAPITDLFPLDDKRLLVADDAGGVVLWHTVHQEPILTLQRDDAPVRAFARLAGSDAVLAFREDGTCAVWGSTAPSVVLAEPDENLWISAVVPCDAAGRPSGLRAGEPAYVLIRGTVRAASDVSGAVEVLVNDAPALVTPFASPAEGGPMRPLDMIIGPFTAPAAGVVRLRALARSSADAWPGPATDDEVSVEVFIAGGE